MKQACVQTMRLTIFWNYSLITVGGWGGSGGERCCCRKCHDVNFDLFPSKRKNNTHVYQGAAMPNLYVIWKDVLMLLNVIWWTAWLENCIEYVNSTWDRCGLEAIRLAGSISARWADKVVKQYKLSLCEFRLFALSDRMSLTSL